VYWIRLAEDREKGWVLGNTVMNCQFHKITKILLVEELLVSQERMCWNKWLLITYMDSPWLHTFSEAVITFWKVRRK
jgi:hypothetical protein